jgi:hypothetical protein
MSQMSFGAGAGARGRIGNVFLAFTQVKRARCQSANDHENCFWEASPIGLPKRTPTDFDLYFSRFLI